MGKNLLLAAASVLLTLLLIEGATRLAIQIVYGRHDQAMWWRLEYEPYLLFRWSETMREPHPAKGEAYRVLVLGGSTAAMALPEQWATAYREFFEGPVEVINLAQGGYIANQDRVMLALYGLELEPDLVINLDGYNDIINALKTGDPGRHYWNGYIETAVRQPVRNALYSLLRRSQFVNAMVKLQERRLESQRKGDAAFLAEVSDRFARTLASISVMARGLDAPHLLVLQPYLHLRGAKTAHEQTLQSESDERRTVVRESLAGMHRRLAELARGEGVYYVDARRPFESSRADCFTDEVHLTEEGVRLLLRHVFREAAEAGFRPRRRVGEGGGAGRHGLAGPGASALRLGPALAGAPLRAEPGPPSEARVGGIVR